MIRNSHLLYIGYAGLWHQMHMDMVLRGPDHCPATLDAARGGP